MRNRHEREAEMQMDKLKLKKKYDQRLFLQWKRVCFSYDQLNPHFDEQGLIKGIDRDNEFDALGRLESDLHGLISDVRDRRNMIGNGAF